jgi:hypothetical protein
LDYETIEGLLDALETNVSQVITAEDFVLVRFGTKKTKVPYVVQVEEKEGFTYKVKLMHRLGETWHFAFPDQDYVSKIEREGTVAKLPRPISSGGISRTTTLKYFGVNFSFVRERFWRWSNRVLS